MRVLPGHVRGGLHLGRTGRRRWVPHHAAGHPVHRAGHDGATPTDRRGPAGGGREPGFAQALEQRLAELRFDVSPDGVMDDNTRQAVIAFQKLNGLPRTGMATPDVTNALATARLPDPLKPDGGPTRVEIDLGRQVLFLYVNGTLNKVLPVSTGTGKRYCDEGKCGIATTPKGSFRIERRISGWRKSDLGRLYNPLYFNGGNRYSWLPFGATDPRLSWLRAHPHGFGRSLSKAGVRRYAGLRDVTTPRCSAGRIGRSPSGCCFR